jgi:hypothetical protein
MLVGRSRESFLVHFRGDPAWAGRTLPMNIVSATAHALYGELAATSPVLA